MSTPTQDLAAAGVSIWLDDLSRKRIDSGNLADLIQTRDVSGVTTNPSIFQAAIGNKDDDSYDAPLAALAARRAFGYSRDQGLLMWSLSLPQVAATLAAALVAYEAQNAEGRRLIDEPMLNSVIVLMVVTSVLGPVLTEQFGKRLEKPLVPTPSVPSAPTTTTTAAAT